MLADLRRKALTLNMTAGPPRTLQDELEGWYPYTGSSASTAEKEKIEDDFVSIVGNAYKRCGPIFACVLARAMVFSQARFQFQELRGGRPGRLFGDPTLSLLENPWTNGTTSELLWRMEQDASLAGNFYATPRGTGTSRRIRRMRPDWVTTISGVRDDPEGSPWDLDAEVLAYIYAPNNGTDGIILTPEQVVHYSPIPDPDAQWRGMSWITPVAEEILGDKYATLHKRKYFENGTTTNLVVTYDGGKTVEQVRAFKAMFDESHRGVRNAYKAIHMGGGADIKSIAADMAAADFKAIQGAGETRIAAASGVGAIMARFSEGMQGSSLNTGNYSAAKRQFADMTIRPLWGTAAASLSKPSIVTVPGGSRLWYDARDVELLKEDRKDAADIQAQQASTINSLVTAGYEPKSVIDAVEAGDFTRLIHSGLYSVQLQKPVA